MEYGKDTGWTVSSIPEANCILGGASSGLVYGPPKAFRSANVFNFTSLPFYGGLDPLGKDADNEVRRWFKLIADIEHNRMPTENEVSRQTRLARAEPEGIKRRIRRTAEVYKKQSTPRQ